MTDFRFHTFHLCCYTFFILFSSNTDAFMHRNGDISACLVIQWTVSQDLCFFYIRANLITSIRSVLMQKAPNIKTYLMHYHCIIDGFSSTCVEREF